MREAVAARGSTIFYGAKGVEGRGSFRGTSRGEEYERKDDGVGGSWEDKANQTVNNRGTAERKGSERHGVASEGGSEGRARVRGTTPRQLQNSPSFIVESHDSESPYIPRLLPFAARPLSPPPPLCLSVFFHPSPPALSAFLLESSLLPLFSLPLSLGHIYFYIAVPFSAKPAATTPPADISTLVTPCAYYAYTGALDGTERGD